MSRLEKQFARVARQFRLWSEPLQQHRFWRYLPQILLGLTLIVLATLMFPHSQSYQFSHLQAGDVYLGDEVIAPFTFLVNKSPEEYERDKKAAEQKVPLVFTYVDSLSKKPLADLERFFEAVDGIRASVSPDSIKLRRLQDLLNTNSIIIEQELVKALLREEPSKPSHARAEKPSETVTYEKLKGDLHRILRDVYSIGILDVAREDLPDYVTRISVVRNGKETVESVDDYYTVGDVETVILDEKLRQIYPGDELAVKMGYAIITSFLNPNMLYDAEETQRRIDEAVRKVPLAKGTVLAKERIIDRHERVTKETLEKLNSLAQAMAEREMREGGLKIVLPYVGQVLVVCLALSFTVMFLLVSRREIVSDPKKTLMIFTIFMVILGITFLLGQVGFARYKYLIPVSIASMLLAIFFDSRTAFIGTVTLSLILGAVFGNDFSLMLTSLFVGTVSIFAVREVQARLWILKGIVFITLSYLVSIAAFQFLLSRDLVLNEDYLFATINGVLSPILAYGFMVMFEFAFKVTTASTLLELSDLNKPLLRELAIRAPGTYHHSIMVGNLSEAAAEAIGANALLARVGAYYHDIGKMDMPEYFVENQKGGKNPHEKLTPNMSCLILISHVKRGLEIAEEHKLPKEICDFIPQHHGTNLIGYFYNKALENSNGEEVNETDFRYQGPKPQTKETGIVMLADAVEAVSRTLKDPTVSRIRSLVNSFIQQRLTDSELDECPLTMKDLNQIRESFVKSLTGMFHGRIEYPYRDQEKKGKKRRKDRVLRKV